MRLTKTKREKFLRNLLKFTAPGIAAFFAQLALGAEPKVAFFTGVIILYGVAADFFSKVK